MSEEVKDPHDELRRIFTEFGYKLNGGRSPMEATDEEIEEVMRAFIAAMAAFARKVTAVVNEAFTRVNIAFEPVMSNPELVAAILAHEQERMR